MVTGVSSFALNVSWEPPADDGGRPISGYYVTVNNTERTAGADVRYLLVFDRDALMENTTYRYVGLVRLRCDCHVKVCDCHLTSFLVV